MRNPLSPLFNTVLHVIPDEPFFISPSSVIDFGCPETPAFGWRHLATHDVGVFSSALKAG